MQETPVLGQANRFPFPRAAGFAPIDRGVRSADPGLLRRTCARGLQLRIVRIQNAAPRQDHAPAAALVARLGKLIPRRQTLLLPRHISPSTNEEPHGPLSKSVRTGRETLPPLLFRPSSAAPLPRRGVPHEELFRCAQVLFA